MGVVLVLEDEYDGEGLEQTDIPPLTAPYTPLLLLLLLLLKDNRRGSRPVTIKSSLDSAWPHRLCLFRRLLP